MWTSRTTFSNQWVHRSATLNFPCPKSPSKTCNSKTNSSNKKQKHVSMVIPCDTCTPRHVILFINKAKDAGRTACDICDGSVSNKSNVFWACTKCDIDLCRYVFLNVGSVQGTKGQYVRSIILWSTRISIQQTQDVTSAIRVV